MRRELVYFFLIFSYSMHSLVSTCTRSPSRSNPTRWDPFLSLLAIINNLLSYLGVYKQYCPNQSPQRHMASMLKFIESKKDSRISISV